MSREGLSDLGFSEITLTSNREDSMEVTTVGSREVLSAYYMPGTPKCSSVLTSLIPLNTHT